ncbi:MAG: hypothetical protein ABSD32_23550 [Mycobacterium sp.]
MSVVTATTPATSARLNLQSREEVGNRLTIGIRLVDPIPPAILGRGAGTPAPEVGPEPASAPAVWVAVAAVQQRVAVAAVPPGARA